MSHNPEGAGETLQSPEPSPSNDPFNGDQVYEATPEDYEAYKNEGPPRLATAPHPPAGDQPFPAPAPVQESERLLALDVLRGVALFGILIVNIESFSMITNARRNPDLGGGEGLANHLVWLATWVLADTKFIAIFSMLFGVGIIMMRTKRRKAGQHTAAAYYRRMFALIAFGWFHAHFIWDGDILWFYGVYGLFLYWFAALPGVVLLLAGLIGITLDGFIFGWPWMPNNYGMAIYEIQAYRSDWIGQLRWRFQQAHEMEFDGTFFFALAGMGYMLTGMGLYRAGFITGRWPTWIYLAILLIAFPLGIGFMVGPSQWGSHFGPTEFINFWDNEHFTPPISPDSALYEPLTEFWSGDLRWEPSGGYFVLGSFILTIGWISLAMLLAREFARGLLTRALAAVGRMALTNYLMHSVICTFVFYGHGLGLFERMERVHQALLVLGICLFQLILSPLWLHTFRFGPVEWLWRVITYLQWQPMLRQNTPAQIHTPLERPSPQTEPPPPMSLNA